MIGSHDPGADPADVARAVAAGVSRLVVGGMDETDREHLLDSLAALYAEHTDVRHPFAPLGDTPLRTRAELRAHFERAGAADSGVVADAFAATDQVVHRTDDPEVVIFEFAYTGSANGRSFSVPCIFVIRVRAGQIVESRDYAHHLATARAFGQLDALAHRLASGA